MPALLTTSSSADQTGFKFQWPITDMKELTDNAILNKEITTLVDVDASVGAISEIITTTITATINEVVTESKIATESKITIMATEVAKNLNKSAFEINNDNKTLMSSMNNNRNTASSDNIFTRFISTLNTTFSSTKMNKHDSNLISGVEPYTMFIIIGGVLGILIPLIIILSIVYKRYRSESRAISEDDCVTRKIGHLKNNFLFFAKKFMRLLTMHFGSFEIFVETVIFRIWDILKAFVYSHLTSA